jgi:thiol-disulfide isomerase/thioredoxin
MHLAILYHPNNEYSRATEELVEELKTQTDKKIEFIDVDTKEGMEKVDHYGIVDYPAFIVLTDDGQPYFMWQGSSMPSIAEISSYLNI